MLPAAQKMTYGHLSLPSDSTNILLFDVPLYALLGCLLFALLLLLPLPPGLPAATSATSCPRINLPQVQLGWG